MALAGIPLLFCPPLPPIQLRPGMSLVLGRSRRCDVQLPSAEASRRHASIVDAADGFEVRDLDSTNGTFVNGEAIEKRRLEPGDRIEIGSCALTFCLVEGGLETSGQEREAQTMLSERPLIAEVFRGDLAQIPTFAVLQMLEMGRNSGLLRLETEEGPARLWLTEGRPIHAETKAQRGWDAALALMNARSGRFTFEPQQGTPESTIEATVTELLLEASRLFDESRA
jgi:pSer/pThr/pTyr-binding forkhead associated (FHA) protein